MRTIHILGILVLLMLALPVAPAHAGGVVSVCDEAHLLAALAGGGTVTFACSGTITLTAEIVIAADTTIDGTGQTVTISGNNAVRVFWVNSGGRLNLNRLTIANGSANGDGGGIHNAMGTLMVNNSTFTSNNASNFGGGIYSHDATLTVSNSTFSGNGAILGGGIYSYGTVMLKNTIVADSQWSGNCYGAIIDGGGNLSYPDTTCPGINADPVLGPLQNNGGPTDTMMLGPGSAAIDAGIEAICAAPPVNNLDQRGIVRPQGLHCDIGSVEQILEPTAVSLSVLSAQSLPGTIPSPIIAGLLLATLMGVSARQRRRRA